MEIAERIMFGIHGVVVLLKQSKRSRVCGSVEKCEKESQKNLQKLRIRLPRTVEWGEIKIIWGLQAFR